MKIILVIFVTILLMRNTFSQSVMVDIRDKQSYKIATIGTQTWMLQNLNYASEKSWCYDNNDTNCINFGRLYSFEEAVKACPEGWHLPTDEEWMQLETNLGVSESELKIVGYRGMNAAPRDNSLGFNVPMSGYRLWWDGSYHYKNMYADFWTATPDGNDEAWLRNFSVNEPTIYRNRIHKNYGHSVRCVKNN